MILRKYLYIDVDFVNDAFSMINGFDYDFKGITQEGTSTTQDFSESLEQREKQEKTATSINANMTLTAKLQSVLNYLSENSGGQIQYFESMDAKQLSSIKREDFFEGCFKLNFTKIESYGLLAETVQKMDELCGTHKIDNIQGIEQLQKLAKQERAKGTPCVLTFINDKNASVYAYLNENYLRGNCRHLLSEVTIICKVVRTIKNGESVCLTDLSELINMKFPNTIQGKSARVQAIKNGSMAKIKDFEDRINGPAIEILPIAIYR